MGNFRRQAVMGLVVIEPLPDVGSKGYEVWFFPAESCRDKFSAGYEADLHKTDSAGRAKRGVCTKSASIATFQCDMSLNLCRSTWLTPCGRHSRLGPLNG